ncbi:MAG: hypothetical protein QXK76_01435 [Candidatus Woesearchaeota archaeon]
MKAKYFIIGGAGVIVFVLLFLLILNLSDATAFSNYLQINSQTSNTQENRIKDSNVNTEYQEAVLSMRNWEYVVTPSTFKKGVPIRMTVDLNTVVGCARDVVIKDFGVRKYVKQGDNIIEFTPTKTGTITIACSMNMFFGKFEVVDVINSQTKSIRISETQSSVETTNTPSKSIGSCGMNSGGCGCMKNI